MLAGIRSFVLRILKPTTWGVALEEEIPAGFVISAHARKRFRERVTDRFTNDELRRHVIKVWFRADHLSRAEARASEPPKDLKNIQYRDSGGFVYVFGERDRRGYEQIYLVTVYPRRYKQ